MVPVPGHTAGSCVVLLDDSDAVVGDLLRAGFAFGRIRRHHPLEHYFAEDVAGVRRALDLVLDHDPRQLYVGRGGSGSGRLVLLRPRDHRRVGFRAAYVLRC
jgi:glyoxylase-like metal-dependent hydrolase (beta-lactamase superfamily II)